MSSLSAIVFDFDGVIADCQRGALLGGAAAFVRQASAAVPIGVASGALTREIEGLLQQHQLASLFTAIVGADRAARSKPSPDPFLEVLHLMKGRGYNVDPARTVAIDDSVWGLIAARTAHLRCVGIASEEQRHKLAPHAELIVTGLHALTLDTLDRLVTGTP